MDGIRNSVLLIYANEYLDVQFNCNLLEDIK